MLDHIGHPPLFFREGADGGSLIRGPFLQPEFTRQPVQNSTKMIFLPVGQLDRLLHHDFAGKVIERNALRDHVFRLDTTMHDIDLCIVLLGQFRSMGKHGRDHAIATHRNQN